MVPLMVPCRHPTQTLLQLTVPWPHPTTPTPLRARDKSTAGAPAQEDPRLSEYFLAAISVYLRMKGNLVAAFEGPRFWRGSNCITRGVPAPEYTSGSTRLGKSLSGVMKTRTKAAAEPTQFGNIATTYHQRRRKLLCLTPMKDSPPCESSGGQDVTLAQKTDVTASH